MRSKNVFYQLSLTNELVKRATWPTACIFNSSSSWLKVFSFKVNRNPDNFFFRIKSKIIVIKYLSSVKKEAEPKAAEKKPTSKKAAENTEEKPKRGRKKKKEE